MQKVFYRLKSGSANPPLLSSDISGRQQNEMPCRYEEAAFSKRFFYSVQQNGVASTSRIRVTFNRSFGLKNLEMPAYMVTIGGDESSSVERNKDPFRNKSFADVLDEYMPKLDSILKNPRKAQGFFLKFIPGW